MKGGEIFRACDRHSVETVTLSKYVAEHEYSPKKISSNFSASSRLGALKLNVYILTNGFALPIIDFLQYLICRLPTSDVITGHRFLCPGREYYLLSKSHIVSWSVHICLMVSGQYISSLY